MCGNIFAIGDASDVAAPEAGSVAHFFEDFVENFLDHVARRPMARSFDEHANWFVESGTAGPSSSPRVQRGS